MSLLKRLLNLWRLSAWEVPVLGEKPSDNPTGTHIAPFLKKKPEQAQIVDPVDPLDRIEI